MLDLIFLVLSLLYCIWKKTIGHMIEPWGTPTGTALHCELELLYLFVSVSVFAPLLRLSPPPSDKDYYFNLDDSEGVSDLFDVPLV